MRADTGFRPYDFQTSKYKTLNEYKLLIIHYSLLIKLYAGGHRVPPLQKWIINNEKLKMNNICVGADASVRPSGIYSALLLIFFFL